MYAGAFNNPEMIHDKRVTVMNKNSEICGAFQSILPKHW